MCLLEITSLDLGIAVVGESVVLLWTTYVLGPYIMAESYVSELVKLCRSLHQFTTLKREYLILYEIASSIIVRKYSTFEVNHSDMLNIYLLLENEYNISGRVTPRHH